MLEPEVQSLKSGRNGRMVAVESSDETFPRSGSKTGRGMGGAGGDLRDSLDRAGAAQGRISPASPDIETGARSWLKG